MRRKDAQTLGAILKESLEDLKIDVKIQETRLLEAWPEIVGPLLGTHTLSLRVYKQVLYVHVDSPILRSEYQMMRQSLVERLNQASGGNTIRDIVFR